ncbi:MAG: DUF5678 domain-containing protein [archaeon]|nr:DUF5678 domain-containing protein [archaeon]
MTTKTITKTYDFYANADLSAYAGEWVIIRNNKVILHGKNAKEILSEFRKNYPTETPFIAKVPSSKHILW